MIKSNSSDSEIIFIYQHLKTSFDISRIEAPEEIPQELSTRSLITKPYYIDFIYIPDIQYKPYKDIFPLSLKNINVPIYQPAKLKGIYDWFEYIKYHDVKENSIQEYKAYCSQYQSFINSFKTYTDLKIYQEDNILSHETYNMVFKNFVGPTEPHIMEIFKNESAVLFYSTRAGNEKRFIKAVIDPFLSHCQKINIAS